MTVMVRKIGGSVAVVIPKAMAKEMKLTEGTPLSLSGSADSIVLRKAVGRRPRRPIKQIVAKIKPASYRRRREELGDDASVGRERW
jgi:antitoxin component of MazEF toxin-antitoxin module